MFEAQPAKVVRVMWIFGVSSISPAANCALNAAHLPMTNYKSSLIFVCCVGFLFTAPAQITFRKHPTGANSVSGSRARFSVDVTNSPPLYYQWFVNGVPIPNADKATYVTPVLSTNNSGDVYYVEVGIAGGQTNLSAPANLWVGPNNGIAPRLQPYIGINFLGADLQTAGPDTAGFLRTNDVAGVVEQEQFNNLSRLAANGVTLLDGYGVATPITISYGPISQRPSGTGSADADHALFQGYIQNSNNPITLTFSNVPLTTNFSLIVYSVGVSNNTTYEESFHLIGQSNYQTFHVRAQDAGHLAAPVYARMSSTDPQHRDVGTYVQFDNVRPAADGTFVLVITPESNGLNSAFLPLVNAVQLVTLAPPPVLPRLSFSHVATPNMVNIAWDATAVGYALESSPTLGKNATWTPVAGVALPIANSNSVNVSSIATPNTYFTMIKKGFPFISQQPQSQIVQQFTSNVSFTVVAIGAPPLTYQWQFSATNPPAFTNILNATNATYTIPTPVDFTNVGDYRVIVTDAPVQSLVAGLSVYNIGSLQTPISQFFYQTCFTCPQGGPCYDRAYVPRDTNGNAYLFYGPHNSCQTGIFMNNNSLNNLCIDAVSTVNNFATVGVELQSLLFTTVANSCPAAPCWQCGLKPCVNSGPFALSLAPGCWPNSDNSYWVTVLYVSTPPPKSGKTQFNWVYQ